MSIKRFTGLIAAMITIAVCLASCTGIGDVDLIVGKWTVYSATIDGSETDVSVMPADKNYFIFNKDGSATASNNNSKSEGSFKFDGEVIALTLGESKQKLLLDGSFLYMTVEDNGSKITMVYQKAEQ